MITVLVPYGWVSPLDRLVLQELSSAPWWLPLSACRWLPVLPRRQTFYCLKWWHRDAWKWSQYWINQRRWKNSHPDRVRIVRKYLAFPRLGSSPAKQCQSVPSNQMPCLVRLKHQSCSKYSVVFGTQDSCRSQPTRCRLPFPFRNCQTSKYIRCS